jgi:hypothetical protein
MPFFMVAESGKSGFELTENERSSLMGSNTPIVDCTEEDEQPDQVETALQL